MQKDTLTLLENDFGRTKSGPATGHARQPRYDPPASAVKTDAHGRPRTVLVTVVAENADDIGATCAAMLAGAGHRVVALLASDNIPSALGDAIAAGRVLTLPGSAIDVASIRKAIKGLAAPFRFIDAVVNIMHVPACRVGLLEPDAPVEELLPLTDVARLLDTTRAAVHELLASERGHVIAVILADQHGKSITDFGQTNAPCAALRAELEDLGIRFTCIAAGPIEHKTGPAFRGGNRPKSNGVPRGLLLPGDIAQAIAWTLAQPGHMAVRNIDIGPASRCQPVLSPRERQVLEWTACGKTSEEISCILELSVSAVNFHLKNLMVKLQCCNKTAAVARAALLGLLM